MATYEALLLPTSAAASPARDQQQPGAPVRPGTARP